MTQNSVWSSWFFFFSDKSDIGKELDAKGQERNLLLAWARSPD